MSSSPRAFEDDICPPWWPHWLWWLTFRHDILGGGSPGGGSPVNKPVDVNEILLNLQVHTISYLISDQAAAKQMRTLALQQLEAGVRKLGAAKGGP